MMRNPVYIGFITSKLWKKTVQGKHAPIVDERTFRNVQLVLKGKKPVIMPYKRRNPDFPLRGFLRCSECGNPLTAGWAKGKFPYYWCYRCHAVKSIDKLQVEGEFTSVLDRLKPTDEMIQDLPSVLKRVWESRIADSGDSLHKLQSELQAKKQLQESLIEKYLANDPRIMPMFDKLSQKYRDEIEVIEGKIADAHAEKATFEDLLAYSKVLLMDIGAAWKQGTLEQKQKVQNILFPSGLNYHPEKGILNSSKGCLFYELENLVAGKTDLASPKGFEPVLPP
jgi:site-specific DNA recombinase